MMIAIAAETPLQEDVSALVAELNETMLALTPPEFCFHMTVEQMAEPSTTVFVARDGAAAVGCGALKRHEGGIGEVKRMYTRPSHRGRKIGADCNDDVAFVNARRFSRAFLGDLDHFDRVIGKEIELANQIKRDDTVAFGVGEASGTH